MQTTKNTILISGGSAGIGFEMARLFSEKGNHVIITGRNEARLKAAAAKLTNVTAIVSDTGNAADTDRLVETLNRDFPALNIVINNAGNAHVYDLASGTDIFAKAEEEMLINYLSVIRLNEKLLPLLRKQEKAAIVNVSSVVAFVPGSLATYSASKAAVHSYSLSLRLALEDTNVEVFELMPPLVNTEFSRPIGGEAGIPPAEVAQALLDAMDNGTHEIHVGNTAYIYDAFLKSPAEALQIMNASRLKPTN